MRLPLVSKPHNYPKFMSSLIHFSRDTYPTQWYVTLSKILLSIVIIKASTITLRSRFFFFYVNYNCIFMESLLLHQLAFKRNEKLMWHSQQGTQVKKWQKKINNNWRNIFQISAWFNYEGRFLVHDSNAVFYFYQPKKLNKNPWVLFVVWIKFCSTSLNSKPTLQRKPIRRQKPTNKEASIFLNQ